MSIGISPRLGIHPAALSANIIEVTNPSFDPQSYPLSETDINFAVGETVIGPHGTGTVIGYNHSQLIYNGILYPYIVKFEDGYIDVYNNHDLTLKLN